MTSGVTMLSKQALVHHAQKLQMKPCEQAGCICRLILQMRPAFFACVMIRKEKLK